MLIINAHVQVIINMLLFKLIYFLCWHVVRPAGRFNKRYFIRYAATRCFFLN